MKQEKIELTYTFTVEEAEEMLSSVIFKTGHVGLRGFDTGEISRNIIECLSDSIDPTRTDNIINLLEDAKKEGIMNNEPLGLYLPGIPKTIDELQ